MKKAFLLLFLAAAAFGVNSWNIANWKTTKYGYSFLEDENGKRHYAREATLYTEKCFQPNDTLNVMENEKKTCEFTHYMKNMDGSSSNWGCFKCLTAPSGITCPTGQYFVGFTKDGYSCAGCPRDYYWSDDEKTCVDDCFRVTERKKRFECICKNSNRGDFVRFQAENQVCNDNGAGLCPQTFSARLQIDCTGGSIDTNDLYKAAVERLGKDKAETIIYDFIYNDIYDYKNNENEYALGLGGDSSSSGSESGQSDGDSSSSGSSSSSGGSSGSNIDGDNPDPFAPKPTRPGVVGGDDSGTGDGTGGSETGSEGEQSGGGAGSDNNSTHGGGGSGNGNNEHADGNGTESGILDELKAFHDENINAAPANGDDIMKIDGKNHELNGEYNKKINDGFRDAIADLNAKVETAQNDIKEAISKIQNGFFQFNKEAVTTCPVVKSFNVAARDIKIEYDFCLYLNKLYSIFYALSFAFVCFMGYKYILSRVFSFGGAE